MDSYNDYVNVFIDCLELIKISRVKDESFIWKSFKFRRICLKSFQNCSYCWGAIRKGRDLSSHN